jgi:2-oxo-4-hydroxy-4-carboxy--5-ureidoimidazoline (OHCU) decarboxylase
MITDNKEIQKKQTEIVNPISVEEVRDRIIILRDQPVMLDSDVAELYGVQTKEINQAVKNNPKKFPYGYVMALDEYEKAELVKNFDRFNTLKHSTVQPKAFTERGLYMMATILKSEQAIATTIAIVDTFAAVKELARTIKALNELPEKEEQKTLLKRSGELMGEIIGSGMATSETETELELNFAVLKVKHTIKRTKNN